MQISHFRSPRSVFTVLLVFIFIACSGYPAGRSDPGLALELFEDLPPGAGVSFSARDNGEFSRRITDTAAKMFHRLGRSGDTITILLSMRIQHWEDSSPGFLTKRYEIYLEGVLVGQDSRRIGTLEGRLEYRRSRLRLTVADEDRQFEIWDQDFVEWSAGKISETLTF